jgi:VHL beta domain
MTVQIEDAIADSRVIKLVNPPVAGFYAKHLDCEQVAVRSAAVVDDQALLVACSKVRQMLARAPEVLANVVAWQTEVHIIGRGQLTSDLPELRWARGKIWDKLTGKDIDERTRGIGGVYASCGEENLLALSSDRYHGGSDICVHEFAHVVMDYGLDSALRKRIEESFQNSTNSGLWTGLYAASNPKEYWAELSMWYFGAHGDQGRNGPTAGSSALKVYDPLGFQLLDDVYSGRVRPATITFYEVHSVGRSTALRSVSAATPAQLEVLNRTNRELRLAWFDYAGRLVPYGVIRPLSILVRATYVTHAWCVEDPLSGEIARFTVQAPYSRKTVF